MNDALEFHIACPQCNYLNTATTSNAKYKEVVYQPFNDNEGQQDHNLKEQIRCDNCDNSFDFYLVCWTHRYGKQCKESVMLNGAFIHFCIVV